jgi:hypothetical protein
MDLSSIQVVAHLKKALSEESVAAHLEFVLKETADLMRTITELPNKTRHRVMVPFEKVAFLGPASWCTPTT